jgi:hypothetical protein
MAKEENERETVADDAPLDEVPVTDAEVLAALGLNENLEPISVPAAAQGKARPKPARAAAGQSAGGANASAADDQDEEPAGDEDAAEAQEEDEVAPETEEDEQEVEEEPEEEPAAARTKGISEMQRRIDKLTAKTKSLEADLARASRPTLRPTESDPLSDLETEAEVTQYLAAMKATRRWALENLEGVEVLDDKGNPTEMSAKDVRARLAHAEEILQEHGPARLAYLRERRRYDDLARDEYPGLFESSSVDAKMMANFLALCPEMLRVPNYQMIIGDAIRGMRVRIGRAKANGPAAKTSQKGGTLVPGTNLAPKAIRSGVSNTARVKSGLGAATRLHREFLESGDKRKLTAMIESTL